MYWLYHCWGLGFMDKLIKFILNPHLIGISNTMGFLNEGNYLFFCYDLWYRLFYCLLYCIRLFWFCFVLFFCYGL